MSRHSITRRLALLIAGTLSAGFLLLVGYMSTAIEHHFVEIDNVELDSAVRRVDHVINNELGGGELGRLHAMLDRVLAGHDRVSLLVTTADGMPLAADSEITFPKAITENAMAKAMPGKSVLFEWEEGGHQYRGVATRLLASSLSDHPLKVAAAMNIDHHTQFMVVFQRTLWVAIAAAIAMSALISIGIARNGLRPLMRLAGQMDVISSQRLNQRLPIDDLPAELAGLANAFNAMLARLDVSFVRLSEFSADIAHELRTPVSSLLTQTQVMLSRERTVDEYREVLASNVEELERLGRMVSDMLFLAKTDNAPEPVTRESVDLGREVNELFEFYEALAAEKSIELRVNGRLSVMGDRVMLRRAINNLLSNAIRYTHANGLVQVKLMESGGEALISVTNPGEAIPSDVRSHLFERFYRADSSRSRNTEGAGLGLAIVKAIAEAHGGSVEVRSSGRNNEFLMRFPTTGSAGTTSEPDSG